jgi:LacI family transcriptional regulator
VELDVVTIRDVAREAGVSIATVSRVYNRSALVREATNQHVRAVADRMDYWPNGAARSLTTSRSHALGVVLPDLFGEFFSEVIRGIDLCARRERYQVLVSSSHADTDALIATVQSMRGCIDGLVAMAPDSKSIAALRGFRRSFPMVLINPGRSVEDCGAISIANYEGAFTLAQHLLSLGHRSIAMIQGPPGNVDAEQRLKGFRAAMREAKADVSALEVPGDFTEVSGYQSVSRLLTSYPRPSAVFAANDYMAIGLMSALGDAGIRVPQDMAVAGFDDITIARYMSPPLTTVRVDAYQLGERAARQLLALARARSAIVESNEVLPAQLVVRKSCGSWKVQAGRATDRSDHSVMEEV